MVWPFDGFSSASRRRTPTGKPPRNPLFPRARLGVEEMEPRDLLAATLLWVAQNAGVFSQANNFLVKAVEPMDGRVVGAASAPQANDTLIFDPTQSVGMTQGANTNATNDIANLTLTLLDIDNYTSTITLNQTLTVKRLTMDSGTITSASGINLVINGTGQGASRVGDATMTGAGGTIVKIGTTLNIDADLTLIDRLFSTEGIKGQGKSVVDWNNGTIKTNKAVISVSGDFNAKDDRNITHIGPANGPRGAFEVVGEVGQFSKVGTGNPAGSKTDVEIPFDVFSGLNPAVNVTLGGILRLRAGGESFGKFSAATNSSIVFTPLSGLGQPVLEYTWNYGTTLVGPVFVNNQQPVSIPLNDTATAEMLTLFGGTIRGAGTLEVSGTLNWASGIMEGSGLTKLLQGATATIGGNDGAGLTPPVLRQRTVENRGTVTLKGRTMPFMPAPITFQVDDGAIINNFNNFVIADDSDIDQVNGPATSRINLKGGLLHKNGGTGTSEIGVDVEWDGGDAKRSSGKLLITGSNVSMLNGNLYLEGGPVEVTSNFAQSGGAVSLQFGTFTVGGAYQQTGGTAYLGGGTLVATGGHVIGTAGVVSGSGTIVAHVTNAGRIDVGGAGLYGSITINGNYSQTGTLLMDLFASSADHLSISGGPPRWAAPWTSTGSTPRRPRSAAPPARSSPS